MLRNRGLILPVIKNIQKHGIIPRFSSSKDFTNNPTILNNSDIPIVDFPDPDYLQLPRYPAKVNEPLEQKKQRLIYQSRKRGMLENDLLLSTFVAKFLNKMSETEIGLYDQLINGPTNDWDIYYWATGHKPTPEEFNNSVMDLLKKHVRNSLKEQRISQPNL